MNLGKPKIHSYTNGWTNNKYQKKKVFPSEKYDKIKTYGAVFFFNFGGGIEGGTGFFFNFGGGIDGGFGDAPVFGGPGILLTSPEYNLLREIRGWGGFVLVLLAPSKSKKRRSRDITREEYNV